MVKRICDERPGRDNFKMPRQNKITKTLGSILQKPHKEWKAVMEQGAVQAEKNAAVSVTNNDIVS